MGKYEEALERARAGKPLDEIFPELNESEDERIRTRLIALVEAFGQGEYKNEMLAYLEKQKEPRDYRKLYEEVVKSDWFKENYVGKSLGEDHQPAEWSEEDETNGWTGVDSERYLSCLKRLETGDPQQPETINSKWFKEHCRFQPKQEWSEEDEEMYELFSYVIELAEDCQDKEKVKNWIKEIKGRFINSDYRSVGLHYILKNNHKYWKPSEYQMKALYSLVFDGGITYVSQLSYLKSLYEDLKNL